MSEPALVLSLASTRDDSVYMHRVDLTGEAVASSGVLGGPRGKQHEHYDGTEVVMGEVGDPAWCGYET